MSPEHDDNLQPSTTETASADPVAENPSTAPAALKGSLQSGAAAATAVARAQEPSTQSSSSEEQASSQAVAEIAPPTESEFAPPPCVADEPNATGEPAAAEETPESAEATETMDQLLDQFSAPVPAAAEGEIFDGRVLAVTEAGVVVDVGGKFEGLVPAQEFLDSGSPIEFGAGQTIEVERLHEQKDGYVLLSHVRAHKRRVWERIEKSYREHTNVTGKVTERIKGGLVVDIGVRAFLPASQIELRPVHDLDTWKDRDIELRVLKLNRKRGNVVVSRRVILEEEQKSKRDALLATL